MLPTIGVRVDVERSNKDPKKGRSRVLDITKELIVLDLPFTEFGGHVLLFNPNDSIFISYQLNDGAVYSFTTHVVDSKFTMDNLPAMSIKVPLVKDIDKIQRREFVRVPVRTELSFLYLSRTQKPVEIKTGEGYTWDISGGGLSFYANTHCSIQAGDAVTVKYHLPNEPRNTTPISAKGNVVRIRESTETNVSIISVQYEDITRAFEQRVIRFVFQRQIELKNKGVGS